MAVLNVFEKKGLCPFGIRPWICVFFVFIYLFIFIQIDQDAMSMFIV
jgi:hypothetical protein